MHRYTKAKLKGKKHLIFFYGEANSGKTTTLRALGRILLETGEMYREDRIKTNSKGAKISAKDWRIYSSWSNINVFICTMGDTMSEIVNAINDFVAATDDIAIVASRWDSATFVAKHKGKCTAINSLTLHDIPSIKEIDMKRRVNCSYTTARELYLLLIHLVTTGNL